MESLPPGWPLLLAALAGAPPGTPVFLDATARAGIDFIHCGGSAEKDFILEVNGSGAVLFDADGDADLDLYLPNGSSLDPPPGAPAPRDALYRNLGGWRFQDVTAAAGLGDARSSCGASAADVDNDGDLDL